jgi:hypothetical protein
VANRAATGYRSAPDVRFPTPAARCARPAWRVASAVTEQTHQTDQPDDIYEVPTAELRLPDPDEPAKDTVDDEPTSILDALHGCA